MASKILEFSQNWNGKLYCKHWTTIRLRNNHKYRRGDSYDIYLKDEFLGIAELIGLRYTTRGKLNEFVCYLDTGYDVVSTQNMLGKMYGRDRDKQLGFYLFKWVKLEPGCSVDITTLKKATREKK